MKYSFRPGWLMSFATLACAILFLKAGFWQYNKAEIKTNQQLQLNKRLAESPLTLQKPLNDIKDLNYKRVKVQGYYNQNYQIFLDNQVDNTAVGYHVLTPLQVQGSKQVVLINRGWIKGLTRRESPIVKTPNGLQLIEGSISVPASRFFTLETPSVQNVIWQPIWQNLDLNRYVKSVPFKTQPFVVRMDAKSDAGGFVRNWPIPGERITKHLGYAYQWFGFALTIIVIYIVLNIKKVEH